MFRPLCALSIVFALTGSTTALGSPADQPADSANAAPPTEEAATAEPADAPAPPQLEWHTSYSDAVHAARQDGKMLLLCFHDPRQGELCDRFAREALADANIAARLKHYVRAKLPVNTTVSAEQGEIVLLKHSGFAEMRGRPGVAIIDYAHRDAPYYGHAVSTFPFRNGRPYTPRELAVILDLPPGTLTQRTLIYAVRTHPDAPASTDGRFDPYLAGEACSHSRRQARIRRQGHHNWDRRFHRINARLPRGLSAREVCAESWPGEGLVEAAIECVRCWRLSSGHWSAVRGRHPAYGYDMKRGANGIWYATGIFGCGSRYARQDDRAGEERT